MSNTQIAPVPSMARGAPWYNEQLVSRKGSVILQQWRSSHGPEATRSRQQRAAQRRGYAGAAYGRTVADWIANSTSADSELYTSLRTLRNRARQLVRDNEYAAHAIDRIIPNNIVGQGVRFQAQVMMRRGGRLDGSINSQIEREWGRWTRADACHTAGKLSFQDIERVVIRSTAEAGEILVRMVKRRFGRSRVPLSLELLEADQLVDNWSGRTHEGREVRMGVEVDEWQRPVAYWFYPRHPGDYTIASTVPSNDWIRVPADEILHIARFDRPMQTRGVPWLHSVLIKLRHVGGYEEAEIVRARASASVMGFIQTPDVELPTPDGDPSAADDIIDGEKVFDFSPGTIKQLGPGEKFEGFAPNSANQALEPFMRFMIRSFAAGGGFAYESVSRDYSQSNYSSSRLALTEDRDNWRVMQSWLIRAFHQRVYEAWLELAVLSGALNLPAYESDPEIYQAVRWAPRGWDWIDPLKEVAAYKAAVRAGFTTVDDVIASKGDDIEEVFKRRRRELDLAEEHDLVLDTDPAQVNDKGAVQAGETAPVAGGKDGAQENPAEDDKAAPEERRRRLQERQDRLLLRAAELDEQINALA